MSFPSGHATQAVAVASVVASHYDSLWVKLGAYGLASLVGWSRMHDKAHYASDVVAGALIGIVVGNAVVRLHESQRFRISAAPSVNRGSAVVALMFGTSLDDVLRFIGVRSSPDTFRQNFLSVPRIYEQPGPAAAPFSGSATSKSTSQE